jgi:homoserine kinase
VFEVTAAAEGHPDNVAPAVFGGFTVSAPRADGGYTSAVLPIPRRWRLLFGIPPFELPTERARAVLPSDYPRADVITTASRAALWALAVARDEPELLETAAIDVLHEPYREPLVPGLAEARRGLRAAGAHAAFLSGAGPTIGAVVANDTEAACRSVLEGFVGSAGRVLRLSGAGGYQSAAIAAG